MGGTVKLPVLRSLESEEARLAVGATGIHSNAIDVCAALLEGPLRTDDLERAFDGISRLCSERPDDFATRIEPLRTTSRK